MHSLENDYLKIWVKPKGAELKSLTKKSSGEEFMWNADPLFWGKTSPILFPIVGTLKNGYYQYQGEKYELPRHGFARDMQFSLEQKSDHSLTFLLTSNDETKGIYPFEFELRVIYVLEETSMTVNYEVRNTGHQEMLFSLGAHPAFKVPIDEELSYEDYYIEFAEKESLEKWKLTNDGLVSNLTEQVPLDNNKLLLNKDLFKDDALVFKNLKSKVLKIGTSKSRESLVFQFDNFPFFGIWAAPNANFVCLEPWCGIADSAHHNQELTSKEGIERLRPSEKFSRSWSCTV